jgi:hypothetical protein
MFGQPNNLLEEDASKIEDHPLTKRVKYLSRCNDALWSRWTTVNRNRMVRLAAKLQRWRRMMLGTKGKKYHVTRYGGEMSDLCRKTLAEYQATAIRSVFF